MRKRWWWAVPTAAFAVSRAWLLAVPAGWVPYHGGTLVMNDVVLYGRWAQMLQTGNFPVGDQMWQYPPLIGPVLAAGAAVPPDAQTGLILTMLAFDIATFIVLMWAARSTGRIAGAWVWIVAGVAVGPVWLTRFDVIPALFAVLALLSVSRPVRAGAWMAVGALLKVWPVLLLLAVPRRGLWKAVVGFVAVSGTLLLVLVTTMNGAGSFASEQRSRGLQLESVPAWFFLVGQHLGWPRHFEYRYGAMEVMASGTQVAGMVVTILAAAGLITLAVLRLFGRLDHATPADIALVVILLALVTSRVLSPQYLVWVAAIASVCLLSPTTAMRPVILLLLPVPLLGQILYPMHYEWLMSDRAIGLIIQSVRITLLLIATVWGAWRLLRESNGVSDVRVDAVQHVRQSA